MGLAISVHMLNLLAIPFIGLIMYYKLKPNLDGNEFMIHVLAILGVLLVVTLITVNMIMPATSNEYLRLSDTQLQSNTSRSLCSGWSWVPPVYLVWHKHSRGNGGSASGSIYLL